MNQILNKKSIKYYLDNNPEQFRIFDIPYLEKTKRMLDTFKIDKMTVYTNYGDNNLEDLKDHLKSIGSNSDEDINLMDKTIKDLTEIIMRSVDKKYTNHWLIVRTTTVSLEEFNTKRWHCDGNYFGKIDKDKLRLDVVKFITILQGPGTFFIKTTPKQRELLESIKSEELEKSKMRDSSIQIPTRFDMEYRKAIDSRIEGIRVQSEKYQGAIFVSDVNKKNVCGVHSEPKIDGPRMLLSIVPCTREEADFHKSSHTAIPIEIKGGGDNRFYIKYLKYKNKYLRLKALGE
jgi:nitrogen regulatory protein PII